MNEKMFFDTYAMIEIIKGNENYRKYRGFGIILTKLNLFELYYSTMRDYGEGRARKELLKNSVFVVDFDNSIIENAAKLRFMFRKQNMSMTDCIGYIKARELGIRFLTGDRQFEFLPDVEFIK